VVRAMNRAVVRAMSRAVVRAMNRIILMILFSLLQLATATALAQTSPKFEKRKIHLGGKTVVVEIADTDERRAYGLMFRNSLPKDEGMLFIFEDERIRSFWMKNTLIPLSIAYINKDKILTEIVDMQPAILGAARPKSYPSKKKSMYALEMNIGWFERNKIWPGVQFRYADKAP
jgi:hypothetical protein